MASAKEWLVGELAKFESVAAASRERLNDENTGKTAIGAISAATGVALATAATTQTLASAATGLELAGMVGFGAVAMGFTGMAAGACIGVVCVGLAIAGADAALGVVKNGAKNLREKLLDRRSKSAEPAPSFTSPKMST